MTTQAAREEMVARFRAWETEDLIRAAKIDSHGYTPEALALIAEELATRNDSVDQLHELEEVVAESHDREVQQLTGIKGWLLVLVLVVANGSATSLVNAARSIRQVPSEMQVFAFIAGAYGVFGLVTLGLLLSKHRRAPGFARTLFLSAMAISLVEAFYFYYREWRVHFFPLATMASGALWFTYLSVSKRVKATFRIQPPENRPILPVSGPAGGSSSAERPSERE